MFDAVNLKSGKICCNHWKIDINALPSTQIDGLEEDLIQIAFGDKIHIDVGWYPQSNPSGFMHIVVIEDSKWYKPLFSKRVVNLIWVPKVLQEAIDFADGLYRSHAPKK